MQNEREKILVNKCLSLEIQIEKLMHKLYHAGKSKNFPVSEISVRLDQSRSDQGRSGSKPETERYQVNGRADWERY